MAQDDDDLGARVRAARSYANLSQQGLADAIGVDRRIVGYIEANESRHELTVPEAQRIADVCDVPVSFLVNGWAAPRDLREMVVGLQRRVAALEGAQRGTLTRDQAEQILSELVDHATAAQGPSHGDGQGRPREAG